MHKQATAIQQFCANREVQIFTRNWLHYFCSSL